MTYSAPWAITTLASNDDLMPISSTIVSVAACECCNQQECVCLKCRACHLSGACCQCESNPWQLPGYVHISRLAADFYTLYALRLEGKDQGYFDKHVEQWLPILKNYTDMVVGGEVRHAGSRDFLYEIDVTPLVVELKCHGSLYSPTRSQAWNIWWHFRQKHGSAALMWAATIFRGMGGSSSVGGDRWANITETLLWFERGVTTPIIFLDSIWGLQHNGGCYFNKKAWDIGGLQQVLDDNLAGRFKSLLAEVSPKVRELYQEVGCTV